MKPAKTTRNKKQDDRGKETMDKVDLDMESLGKQFSELRIDMAKVMAQIGQMAQTGTISSTGGQAGTLVILGQQAIQDQGTILEQWTMSGLNGIFVSGVMRKGML